MRKKEMSRCPFTYLDKKINMTKGNMTGFVLYEVHSAQNSIFVMYLNLYGDEMFN